jgi:hypothetical protein
VGRRLSILAFGLPALVCAAWTVYAGKDVNWDLLNYHYYLPFELLKGRLSQDFYAASAQGYLNPLGYVPFYLMVSSGWHSVVASVVLALAHSLAISLLFFVSWRLFAHLPQGERIGFSLLAAALGSASAVYWETVGTSFIDPLLVPPMLAGLLLLLGEGPHAARRAAVAGLLFGAAAALKYSNAIFGFAALPLAATMPGVRGSARWRVGLSYVAGGALAVAVLAGPWLFMLWREFGNPVFPLMNGWFRSPYAPPVNMLSDRFTLDTLTAALEFPFRMVALDTSLYSENFAPDLRFAALLVGVVGLPLVAAIRRSATARPLQAADWRVLAFFCAGLALWLVTSANGRYGMVVLLLVGVCLARLVEFLFPLGAARVFLVVLIALQVTMTAMSSPARWFIAEPWSRRWLPYDVPEQAMRERALYLTVEMLPMAVIAAFVNPASSFVNVRGQLSIPPDSPKLGALLARYQGHVRALGRGLVPVDGKPRAEQLKAYDETLLRIGYRVDPTDCFTIAWRPDGRDAISRVANFFAGTPPPHEPLSAASCRLRPVARDPAQMQAEHRYSALLDHIERTCPRLFRGQTAVTEPLGSGWSRYYGGLDLLLVAAEGRVIAYRYHAFPLDLGAMEAWERADAPLPPACLKLKGQAGE